MKTTIRKIAYLMTGAAVWFASSTSFGQIVINEIVEDEQDFESTDIAPDTRDFLELYNAGNAPVDITGWQLNYFQLGTAVGNASYFATADTITNTATPGNPVIIPSHGYYVLGNDGVPHVNQALGAAIDLYPHANAIFELWNGDRAGGTATLVDAVGIDTFRGAELSNASQAQVDQIAAGKTAGAGLRGGWWGQVESNDNGPDASYPNLPMSIARYKDGLDHNNSGRDFGMLPVTPGTSNNLPQVTTHVVPDVNATAVDTVLRSDYYASFKLPRVIDPTVATVYNPKAIPVSPQGGKAIVAWDETGGGNADYSNKYANQFKLYAYIDPTPLNVPTANTNQNEATIYGIAGTTDVFFGTPNVNGILTGQPGTGGNLTSSSNGSTGVGWAIQRVTINNAGAQSTHSQLALVDFKSGGDSATNPSDWTVQQVIDISGLAAGWHILGIKYDPVTGNVIGTYDTQTFNFTTTTDLVGDFYVGYREARALGGSPNLLRPPTYDLFVQTALAGDYNGDGKVNAADYVLWRKNPANFGGDPAGYITWRNNLGSLGSGLSAGT